MEGDVVLTHELVKLNVFGVLPPLFIFISPGSCYGDIANRSIEPHIEHFVFVLFQWNWYTPFEVSGDASALESLTSETVSKLDGIISPLALDMSLFEPFLMEGLDLWQVYEDVLR